MQPGDHHQDADSRLRILLERLLPTRGHDKVTATSDLWAHVKISPVLRDAALKLQGTDLYKKVKPPGDTTLYKTPTDPNRPAEEGWELQPLAYKTAPAGRQQQFSTAELATPCALPAGNHVLPEELKGVRVQPPQPRLA